MRLNEIANDQLKETDIPIVYDLLQGLLKKGVLVRFIGVNHPPSTWVQNARIEYDHEREIHTICVTLQCTWPRMSQTLAWQIPTQTDRLVLEKRKEGYVFFDSSWVDEHDT